MLSPFTAVKNGLRRTPLRKTVMAFRHTGLNTSDVFLASYPRSGNTWLKSLLASSIFGEAMENFSDTVNPVIPIVGYHRKSKPLLPDAGRIIKTHESYRPEYSRAVWIVRDPRDVVLSEYRLQLRSQVFVGAFEDYVQQFTRADSNGPPNWMQHTESWIDSGMADNTELLSVRFEDMKRDVAGQLERVLKFMGLESSPQIVETAISQNSLHSMAVRHAAYDKTLAIQSSLPAVNQGKTGGWREQLTAGQIEMIEDYFGPTMARLGYDRSTT